MGDTVKHLMTKAYCVLNHQALVINSFSNKYDDGGNVGL